MLPLTIADIASENDDIAFSAFVEFVGPALWTRVVSGVRRAKPGTCACRPERPPLFNVTDTLTESLCERCMNLWTDRLMNGFRVLRQALAGSVPTIGAGSNAGEEIHEWRIVRDHIVAPEAELEDVSVFGVLLRDFTPRDETPAELDWLRKAWAQLVNYPTSGRIVPTVRRESADERGLPTRPEVAISTAAWAAPLRVDPVDRDILIVFLLGIRDEITDPFSLPSMELKFGLTAREVSERLEGSLALLRRCNRDFYERAVAVPLAETAPDGIAGGHAPSPEDICAAAAETSVPRNAILAELEVNLVTKRLLQAIADIAHGGKVDVGVLARRLLRLDEERAGGEVDRLARLVAGAGVEWVDVLLHDLDGLPA
ncbi:hypothetical protein [Frankia sp. Cas3]|uniref:hypothetical protein n=1 Tax=Frankia sp. Cas3 TaxID=3073926 RepID=UPI002AD1DC25|nr:hypothetical protein [Frankia sp. Cas3]